MKLKKGFTLREVCGEHVIIGEGVETVNFGQLINLNATAALLWKKAVELGDFTVEQLADALTDTYEVSPEQALSDVEALTARWIEAGLIER
ncbi:MAG: PqqD family protein [Prevotella sp.]|nr:PqqD family protein [Prevotella sp.]